LGYESVFAYASLVKHLILQGFLLFDFAIVEYCERAFDTK
jgi:hypothetical protein